MLDNSPILLALYLCGLLGMILSVGEAIGINAGFYTLIISFLIIVNIAFWYLYFYQSKIFIYVTIGVTLACCLIAIPEIYALASEAKTLISMGLPLNTLTYSTELLLSLMFLISFLLFALEFVMRNHSLLFMIGLAILIIIPVAGYTISFIPMIMLSFFEFSFVVLNMTERRNLKNSMKSTKRARVSMISALLTASILLVSFIPAFFVEQNNENDLFSVVYQADGWIKDIISNLTNNNSQGINGGSISRGNLYQSGEDTLSLTFSKLPTDRIYLRGYIGQDYSDSEWSSAYNVSVYDDGNYQTYFYRENFMNPLISSMYDESSLENDYLYSSDPEIPESFTYLTANSSDVISEMYYLLADGSELNAEIGTVENNGIEYYYVEKGSGIDNPNANTVSIKHIDENYYNTLYIPYYSEKSNFRISSEGGISRRNGYSNSFITADEINMTRMPDDPANASVLTIWGENPFYENFTDKYMNCIQDEYTSYPEETFTRLREYCDETPLDSLEEITTYILVTLQNKAVYSTTPGTTPFNRDVIDYFLFDNGMGYCVHFASAATLMYRMYGIPARYVSGYVVDNSTGEYTSTDGGYTKVLTDESAHAWVEIFLKDYGWVPVEVTPTTDGTMNASYPGYNYSTMRRVMSEHGWTFRSSSQSSSESTSSDDEDDDNSLIPMLTVIVPIGLVIAAVVFVIVRHLLLKHALPTMGCRRLFHLMIKLLQYRKPLRGCTGSETDFAVRLSKEISSVTEDESKRLVEILQEVTYSENKVPKSDRDFVEECYHRIRSELSVPVRIIAFVRGLL